MDRAADGQGGRGWPDIGSTHLDGSWPGSAPYPSFKLSNDPKFAANVRDIVGLYVDPTSDAMVLSFDEKSQIQGLGSHLA